MKERLSRARLQEILQACRTLKVGVIGDFTLDAYWYADMTQAQLSRETPLFARPVVRETYSPGGAANVAWNVADLGVKKVYAFTVLGTDWRGELFRQVLERVGVSLDYTLFQAEWSTPLYGKVVLMNRSLMQEDPRIDFVNTSPLRHEAVEHLQANVAAAVHELDAVIVADYQTFGILNAGFRLMLNGLAGRTPGVSWVADSRQQIGSFPAMVLKPNEIEATRLLFPEKPPETVSEQVFKREALALQAQTGKPFFVTQGERGCWLFDQGQAVHIPAVKLPPPIDPVGAGDTFVSCLAACLAAGADSWEAASIATLAAAVTVRMLNITGTASPDAILQQYDAL